MYDVKKVQQVLRGLEITEFRDQTDERRSKAEPLHINRPLGVWTRYTRNIRMNIGVFGRPTRNKTRNKPATTRNMAENQTGIARQDPDGTGVGLARETREIRERQENEMLIRILTGFTRFTGFLLGPC